MPCCPRDALCDTCVADAMAHLRGVAQCRGEHWARSIPRRAAPWPDTPRMRAIALRKVRDLADDARLRDRLAAEVVIGARRAWDA